jgi:hypothetical protein
LKVHSCFRESAAVPGILGCLLQIHPSTPHVTTSFEVHRQFGRGLAGAFTAIRFLPLANLTMQNGSTAGGNSFVKRVAVQDMIELEPRPGMSYKPVLPGKTG